MTISNNIFTGYLILLLISHFSCQSPRTKTIPESMLLDITYYETTYQLAELAQYEYPGDRPSRQSNRLTSEEQELIRNMIENNFEYSINYKGNRAIAIVDISKSGAVEWYNLNKTRFSEDYNLTARNKLFLMFEFRDGRWWYFGLGVDKEWDGFEIEHQEWELLNFPERFE